MNHHLSQIAKKRVRLQARMEGLKQRLSRLQNIRLWLGISTFFLFIFSQVFKGLHFELVALLLTLPVFIFYFRKSRALDRFIAKLQALESFYEHQSHFQRGLLQKEVPAEEMQNPNLARDLDLGLLFSNIDFTFSVQGRELLNSWLCQNFQGLPQKDRREIIHNLVEHPGLIRRLFIEKNKTLVDFDRIENDTNRSFFQSAMPWKWLIPLNWMAMVATGLLSSKLAFLFLVSYLILLLLYLSQSSYVFKRLQDLHNDFSTLEPKFIFLEKLAHHISRLQNLSDQETSQGIGKLNTLISFMSAHTNPFAYIILNFIFPIDFTLIEISEKYRKNLNVSLKNWGQEIAILEAAACLANLKIYHNTQWAEEGDFFLDVKGLSHPLLDQSQIVTNDFAPENHQVVIITGSNMSGKSTFLRAVGINFCLANIGAPVFAESFKYKPMPIVSCIRVSDSLRDGQSYFYAEVQRMKAILEVAKEKEILFLIDEPLRGTNNKERLIGNQSYLRQILDAGACGFISTHDLELTQLASEDQKIINKHFSEKWSEEDLKFDYKIKPGPSESTNALKILAREGLYQQAP